MGTHLTRCGFMFPLRIALTLGQVAHATLGRTLRGRWGLWPFWATRPKFTQKWSLEKSYLRITKEIGLGLFAWMQTEALLPFCDKGWGSKRWRNIFNTSILEAHYIREKVHISAILGSIYLWVIEEQKYE